jgi:hypothetical protein
MCVLPVQMSIEERVAHERKHIKLGGGGIQFDPSEVKDDGGDATLDDFFGALGMDGGDGPIPDDDDEEEEKKPADDVKPEDEAWMKVQTMLRRPQVDCKGVISLRPICN